MLAAYLLLLAPPKAPVKFNPAIAGFSVVTSASQFADVSEKAPCYPALALLASKFGSVGRLGDGKFHPEMECTYGELLQTIDLTLNWIVDDLGEEPDEAKRNRALEALFATLHKNPGAPLTSSSQMPGLKANSRYLEHVRSLVERYGAFVGLNPAKYSDYGAVSREELAEFGVRIFGDGAFKRKLATESAKARAGAASRSEMATVVGAGAKTLAKAIGV